MKTKHILIVGAILFVTLITILTNFSGLVNGETKSNYMLVEAKVYDSSKKEYYMQGRDPYVYQSPSVKVTLTKEQHDGVEEGMTYFMKYTLYEDGTSELESFQKEQR